MRQPPIRVHVPIAHAAPSRRAPTPAYTRLRCATGVPWILVAVFCVVGGLIRAPATWADGTLPPHPYHYLHPPPAFAAENVRPFSGRRSLFAGFIRTSSWFQFTDDGQAGVTAPKGAFTLSPSKDHVVVTIQPVDPPAGLPAGSVVDGNAYGITATQHPGNKPARLVHPVIITFQWPRLPSAIELYANGSWRTLCSLAQSIRTPTTMSCNTLQLGTFAPVVTGHTLRPTPATSGNNRTQIVFGVLVIVLILLALGGFLAVRRRPRRA